MIKSYDPNAEGIHAVRIAFMQLDYIGHVTYKIGGNCHGANLLNADFLATDNQADIDRYLENDCDFSFHADEELYTATLHNADGDALEVEDDANGFEDMVVAIEFSGLREARP